MLPAHAMRFQQGLRHSLRLWRARQPSAATIRECQWLRARVVRFCCWPSSCSFGPVELGSCPFTQHLDNAATAEASHLYYAMWWAHTLRPPPGDPVSWPSVLLSALALLEKAPARVSRFERTGLSPRIRKRGGNLMVP